MLGVKWHCKAKYQINQLNYKFEKCYVMETVETLLKPVSEDNPCGENIEYDQEFGELSRDVQGEP